MHHCLQIHDVVDIIFSHLGKADFYGDRDLAVLARTCKSFHGPALDRLWRSVTLGNLLRCLPRDLCVFDPVAPQRFLRPIRSADWDRVRIYASRVRKLYRVSTEKLTSIFLPILNHSLPSDLLCNLRSVSWSYVNDDFRYISIFLPAQLTYLYVGHLPESNSALPMFSTLAQKCPNLTDVHISSQTWTTVVDSQAQAISAFIRGLQHIQSIKVPVLDQDALNHLGRLPTFQKLTLNAVPTSLSLSATDGTKIFAALRTLCLCDASIEPTIQFLSLCNRLRLTSFDLWLSSSVIAASEMHDLLGAISSTISHSSLTSLTVDRQQDSANHIVRSDSVRVLLPFVNLTAVSIRSPGGFDFDNATVSAMARAWQRIETLHLSVTYPVRQARATFECLSYFAHCLHLRALEITLDCAVIPHPGSVSQHRLTQLNIGFSTISAPPIAIAHFISDVFPNVLEIRCDWIGYDPDNDELDRRANEFRLLWKEVESEIRLGEWLEAASNLGK